MAFVSSGRTNRGPAAAAQNRAAILAAARIVFSHDGPSAAMSAISTAAGVGPGVLYRHFPDRRSLTQAVFDEDIAALEVIADRGTTLAELLAAVLDQLVACTAFVSTIRPGEFGLVHVAAEQRMRAVLESALAADTVATFRAGTTAEDLLLAIGLVAALLTKTDEPMRRTVADTAWRLIVDGLRDVQPAL